MGISSFRDNPVVEGTNLYLICSMFSVSTSVSITANPPGDPRLSSMFFSKFTRNRFHNIYIYILPRYYTFHVLGVGFIFSAPRGVSSVW